MSWVRWGSKCNQGFPFRQSACSFAPADCPGSSVYVYEGGANDDRKGFVCMCGGADPAEDFVCATEAEMRAHLKEHFVKGDHVPLSLLG
jgi:hypothetical protein